MIPYNTMVCPKKTHHQRTASGCHRCALRQALGKAESVELQLCLDGFSTSMEIPRSENGATLVPYVWPYLGDISLDIGRQNIVGS